MWDFARAPALLRKMPQSNQSAIHSTASSSSPGRLVRLPFGKKSGMSLVYRMQSSIAVVRIWSVFDDKNEEGDKNKEMVYSPRSCHGFIGTCK